MSTFTSTSTINKPVSEVYSFLADMNNHQQLMPDSISEWASTVDTASFNVQGMLKLILKVNSRVENTSIKVIPAEKPPFDLELIWTLSAVNGQTEATFTIKADLNMMMKMMASGPLQKLAEYETYTLAKILR